MSNEEIKQRIQYLIEHGGVWDDPIEDIRRQVKLNFILIVATMALLVAAVLHYH